MCERSSRRRGCCFTSLAKEWQCASASGMFKNAISGYVKLANNKNELHGMLL